MSGAIQLIASEIKASWKKLVLVGVTFALVFQCLMLIALMVRFQALPNYIRFYDWISGVVTIIQSTPSWSDIWPIIAEEWLIEIGHMNYDFGMGLSEWSLNVIPSRLVVLFILGALVSLCFRVSARRGCCATPGASGNVDSRGKNSRQSSVLAAIGGGSLMVAMTNATMSWVVCCAAPSWVVGLAMLGLGVSTSLALESMGPVLSIGGFSLLIAALITLAWRNTIQPEINTEVNHA